MCARSRTNVRGVLPPAQVFFVEVHSQSLPLCTCTTAASERGELRMMDLRMVPHLQAASTTPEGGNTHQGVTSPLCGSGRTEPYVVRDTQNGTQVLWRGLHLAAAEGIPTPEALCGGGHGKDGDDQDNGAGGRGRDDVMVWLGCLYLRACLDCPNTLANTHVHTQTHMYMHQGWAISASLRFAL